MYEYRVHTLVDITDNGSLHRSFPFKTPSGEVIKDRQSLLVARNQNNNYNTMLQVLQLRGNITWEQPPQKIDLPNVANHMFGSYYEGPHSTWHFQFFTEQSGVYGDSVEPTENLVEDFSLIPIVADCTNTANLPVQTFVTREMQGNERQKIIGALAGGIINTYFSYSGPIDK